MCNLTQESIVRAVGRIMRRYERKKSIMFFIPALLIVVYCAGLGIWIKTTVYSEPKSTPSALSTAEPIGTASGADTTSSAVISNLNDESSSKSDESSKAESKVASQASNSAIEVDVKPADPESIEDILDGMTMYEKIMQMFIVTPEQLTGVPKATIAGDMTKQALEKYPVGGVIYFAQNLEDPQQVKDMIKKTKKYCKIKPFISVDEEGGSVARLGENPNMGTTSFPAMGNIQTETDAYNTGKTIGKDLKKLGFNLDFAPVADVNSNPYNPVIGTRAFSSDPDMAARLVSSCVHGFNDSGVLCTLKHFPGHGDTDSDSHYGVATTEKGLNELEQCELKPFKSGMEAGADFIMIGHISVPSITGSDVPATMSYEIVTQLLRDRLGFEGVVITDSMLMGAVSQNYSSGIAAVESVKAGVDIILMPENLEEAVNALVDAVDNGEISEERINESVRRILAAKQKIN